jgi:hypothetical protein
LVPFVQGSIEAVSMLALARGALIALGVVLFFLLAAYAIYWIIFKMGK